VTGEVTGPDPSNHLIGTVESVVGASRDGCIVVPGGRDSDVRTPFGVAGATMGSNDAVERNGLRGFESRELRRTLVPYHA
jgi:hypothetical protein